MGRERSLSLRSIKRWSIRAASSPGTTGAIQSDCWVLGTAMLKAVTGLNQIASRRVQSSVQNAVASVLGSTQLVSARKREPERLVERAQNGDREAFEQIYRQQVGRIHALCWRLTGDADLTEELTQEAFVRAWRKLHTFSGRSALSTWLHRLTVNVVMADHRVHGVRRRRQLPLEDVHSGLAEAAPF